jgi:hypothetical protein
MRIWRSFRSDYDSEPRRRRRPNREASRRGAPRARRELALERVEDRLLLTSGPQLISIIPDNGGLLLPGETLNTAPGQLTFRFNQGEIINPATLTGIELVRSGGDGVFGNGNDVPIQPGFIGVLPQANEVVMRFASPLSDDLYQINIIGAGANALFDSGTPAVGLGGGTPPAAFNGGVNYSQEFRLNLSPKILAVVPEPLTDPAPITGIKVPLTNVIDVYFDSPLNPTSATNPAFYQLIRTQNTSTTLDDAAPVLPQSVTYADTPNPDGTVTHEAVLTFAQSMSTYLAQDAAANPNLTNPTTGVTNEAFRLRIGNTDQPLPAPKVDNVAPQGQAGAPGDTFTTSQNVGTLSNQTQVLDSAIVPMADNPGLVYPGGPIGPGVRNIPIQNHFQGGTSTQPGEATTVYYNFQKIYGTDPAGNLLSNQILSTPQQMQDVRDIFGLFAYYSGAKFVETTNASTAPAGALNITVVTGDIRAVQPSIPATAQNGIEGSTTLVPVASIVNGNVNWGNSEYGGAFFVMAMREIASALGLGQSFELPATNITSITGSENPNQPAQNPPPPGPSQAPEPMYPGNGDIASLDYLYRTDSQGVELYKFQVLAAGTFSAETFAQRLTPTSTLNSVLSLYDEVNNLGVPANGGQDIAAAQAALGAPLTFSITDPNHSVVFEFNAGYSLALPAGATGATLAGDSFTLGDGTQTISFKFTTTPTVNTPGTVYIVVNPTDTADTSSSAIGLTGKVAAAINFAVKNLNLGGGISATFLANGSGVINIGGSSVTSFAPVNSGIAITGSVVAQTPGALVVRYAPADSQHQLAIDVANAINADALSAANPGGLNLTATAELNQVQIAGPITVNTTGTTFNGAPLLPATIERDLISRNDDYYGQDPYVNLPLTPGNYYVAVSAAGNIHFDPNVPDSGWGGTSNGEYELHLNFHPNPTNTLVSLVSAAGSGLNALGGDAPQPLDGDPNATADATGTGGSANNFWFNVTDVSHTYFVNKTPPLVPSGPLGSYTDPFTTISAALASGLLVPGTDLRIESDLPNNFANLAPAVQQQDLLNAPSYDIGTENFSHQNATLPDGATFNVPRGVTVMIDAGAIFKMRQSWIDVGSSAVNIDRSQGAVQVLGIPGEQAIFTSLNDNTVSIGTAGLSTPDVAAKGDWGGIIYRQDSDLAPLGIFLNYVDEAKFRFGGGQVLINGQPVVVDPIHLVSSRPTVTNNTILDSSDAAISGNPNSFEDTVLQRDMTITAQSGAQITNGQTFQLHGTIFQFNNNPTQTVLPGNVPVFFNLNGHVDTPNQIAVEMAEAINGAQLAHPDVQAAVTGAQLTLTNTQIDSPIAINTVRGGFIPAGWAFSVNGVIFEFNSGGTLLNPGAVRITPQTSNDTELQVAQEIAAAINARWIDNGNGQIVYAQAVATPNTLGLPQARVDIMKTSDVDLSLPNPALGAPTQRLSLSLISPMTIDVSGDVNPATGLLTVRDGQSFTVNGRVFELDSGYTLVVPANGALGLADNDQFGISDGVHTITFVFYKNVAPPPQPNQVLIHLNVNDSADVVAADMVNAINNSGLANIFARSLGSGFGQVNLGGNAATTFLPGSGQITLKVGQAGDVERPGAQIPGAIAIPFYPTMTGGQLAAAIGTAVSAAGIGVSANVVVNAQNQAQPQVVFQNVASLVPNPSALDVTRELQVFGPQAGMLYALDGQTFTLNGSVFEFDSGYTLRAPANGGAGLAAGDTFSLSDGVHTVNFIFYTTTPPTAQPNNQVGIQFSPSDTADMVAAEIANAINVSVQADLGFSLAGITAVPLAHGTGQVNIGSGHFGSGATRQNLHNALTTVFSPGSGQITAVGAPGAQTPGAFAVPFVPFDASDPTPLVTLANDIAAAINNAAIGVFAKASVQGNLTTVLFQHADSLVTNATLGTNSPLAVQTDPVFVYYSNPLPLSLTNNFYTADYGRVGPDVHGNTLAVPQVPVLTTQAAGTILDGQQFIINNQGFEFDSNSHATAAGFVPVVFKTTDNAAQIAQDIVAAVNNPTLNLGVTAYAAARSNQVFLYGTPYNPTGALVPSNLRPFGAFNVNVLKSALTLTNAVEENTINGLFVRINTLAGQSLDTLDVPARFDATDITYVLGENLIIDGQPGGPLVTTARESARLSIDPGVIVKLTNARIEVQPGGSLIAEGNTNHPITFTSFHDDTVGSGATFDADGDGSYLVPAPANVHPAAGDWGGFYFWPTSIGSLDNVLEDYGGGRVPIEGGFDNFNAVEIYQAQVRITNSTLENNAGGLAATSRNGRGTNVASAAGNPLMGETIFVIGAQPVLVNNIVLDNLGAAISIDANSFTSTNVPDWGRGRGSIDRFTQFDDNDGPLVRLNRIGNIPTKVNRTQVAVNGMVVRGAVLTTNSIWDDTDIVHVVYDTIETTNDTTLRLQSTASQSLVVKLSGSNAGFTATGSPLDISNRVGGSVQVVGMPQHPVVLTSLDDCSVGAGLTPSNQPNNDTHNDGCSGTNSGSGPVVIDGGDRDDFGHGDFLNGKNTGGWLFIQEMVNFAYSRSLNSTGTGILAIGAHPGLRAGDAIASAASVLGLTVTYVNDASISTVDFSKYRMIYIPSDENPPGSGSDTEGGITDAELALLTARKGDVQNYVNDDGGGLVALTEAGSSTPYSWLELPLPFSISVNDTLDTLVQTPALAAAGLVITNTDLNLGTPWHNTFTGPTGFNNLQPWVLDQVTGGVVTLGLPPGSAGIGAGTHTDITLDKYSNDTNVAVVNEAEPAYTGGKGTDETPLTAQSLGQLAPNQQSGDDNLRLGFQVNGTISPDFHGDVDTYTFKGTAGTQAFFNVTNTTMALDSVLELVDANGNVLARSDNAVAEANDPTKPDDMSAGRLLDDPNYPGGVQLANNLALPLQSNTFQSNVYPSQDVRNIGSINPRDPGFRLVLPGLTGTINDYYIRVYSKGATPATYFVPGQGVSSGKYTLNIGLQELVQSPGSVVQYADIRFADNGIAVQGLPGHSPLVADSSQVPNDGNVTDALSSNNNTNGNPTNVTTTTIPQDLGNVLTSDTNSISTSGSIDLNKPTQVDWYKFELNYNLVQSIQGVNAASKVFSTIFQVGYADGLTRPDTTISVFDSNGNLILSGQNSNVADQQPRPTMGNDTTNLTHLSFGNNDPFIGSTELPAGVPAGGKFTYYVAISSNATLPTAMDAYFNPNSAEPTVRLEPIEGVQRVVEDHVGTQGYTSGNPMFGTQPVLPAAPNPILPTASATLSQHVAPFTLSDMTLYVSTADHLYGVNPASGLNQTDYGAIGGSPTTDDIAIRTDGKMFAYQALPTDSGNAGQLMELDPGNPATAANINGDAIPKSTAPDATVGALAWDRKGTLGTGMDYDLFYSVNTDGSFPPGHESMFFQVNSAADANGFKSTAAQLARPEGATLGTMITSPHVAFLPATSPGLPSPVPMNLPDVSAGTTFVLDDAVHPKQTFEYASSTPELTINPGATGTSIAGETITVTLGGFLVGGTFTPPITRTFQFEIGNAAPNPGNIAISVKAGDGFNILAGDAVGVINANFPPSGTTPVATQDGNRIDFENGPNNPPTDVDPGAITAVSISTGPGSQMSMANPVPEIDVNPSAVGSMVANEEFLVRGGINSAIHVFQFVLVGGAPTNPNDIPVFVNPGDNATTLATDAVNAINTAFNAAVAHQGVSPFSNRIVFNDDSIGISVNPSSQPQSGTQGQITVLNAPFIAGANPVLYTAGDTANQLEFETINAINGVFGALGSRLWSYDETLVPNAGGVDAPPPPPLFLTGTMDIQFSVSADFSQTNLPELGQGPGGFINGMAFDGQSVYGVSDHGGVYQIGGLQDMNAAGITFELNTGVWPPPFGDPSGIYGSFLDSITEQLFLEPMQYLPASSEYVAKQYSFEGLTLGPQDLNFNGDGSGPQLAHDLFAVSKPSGLDPAAGSVLVAFTDGQNTRGAAGAPDSVFDTPINFQGQTVPTGAFRDFTNLPGGFDSQLTGLAFSPLDVNLWHVEGGGPGVNSTFDNSRQAAGSGSWRFALDGSNAGQMVFGADLLTNPAISGINNDPNNPDQAPFNVAAPSDPGKPYVPNGSALGTYNLPGGAAGTLVSSPFSLQGYSAADEPTLYFNYELNTRNQYSEAFKTSVRVEVSPDGGKTWSELATNDSARSAYNIPAGPNAQTTELPQFWTASASQPTETNLATGAPVVDPRQQTQELFDSSATNGNNITANAKDLLDWRQARVDLGNFAGDPNLLLRFDFSSSGSISIPSALRHTVPQGSPNPGVQIPGDQFGNPANQNRSQDNEHFGWSISDLIVGFAGRGELVTGLKSPDTSFTVEPYSVPGAAPFGAPTEQLTGPYQLEIRQGQAVGQTQNVNANSIIIDQQYNVADRLTSAYTLVAPEPQYIQNVSVPLNLPAPGALVGTMTFDFTNVPPPSGTGTLTFNAIGTLAGRLQYLAIDFPDLPDTPGGLRQQLQQNIHFDERDKTLTDETMNSTVITFTQAQLQALIAANNANPANPRNVIHITAFPPPGTLVNGITKLSATLTYSAVAGTGLFPGDPNSILDGQTFQISDGVKAVTFEYDDNNQLNNLNDIRVGFNPSDTAAQLAQEIVAAIDQPGLFNVLAATSDAPSHATSAGANDTSDRVNLFGAAWVSIAPPVVIRAAETDETLATATNVPLGFGQPVVSASSTIGQGPDRQPAGTRANDVDLYAVPLNAGQQLQVQVDAASLGSKLDSYLRVFDSAGNEFQNNDDGPTPGKPNSSTDSFMEFTAPSTGTFYFGVSGQLPNKLGNTAYHPVDDSNTVAGSTGNYTITFTLLDATRVVHYDNLQGDTAVVRPQGMVIVADNRITNSANDGVLVQAATREGVPGDGNVNLPHPGGVRSLPTLAAQRFVPGVVIENNIISNAAVAGVQFSGDPQAAGQPLSAVPFGRILNNTIFGNAAKAGVGVNVTNDASPTIMNNIVANLATGINVDASSQALSTVLADNIYQNNTANDSIGAILEQGGIALASTDPLFMNASAGNFYLAKGSLAVDSALASLQDRAAMTAVTAPLGIAPSPILAPSFDINGQLRIHDPTSSGGNGTGTQIFQDRGAIDRVDTTGPIATLLAPQDNGLDDQDPRVNIVHTVGANLSEFDISLSDGIGSGIDNSTVKPNTLDLRQNGVLFTQGFDYNFVYDNNNHIIRLIAASGIWQVGNVYDIYLDNGVLFDPKSTATPPAGIADLAGNFLQPNGTDGLTHFQLILGSPTNAPPAIVVPLTTPQVFEHDTLVFTPNPNPPAVQGVDYTTPIAVFDVDSNGGVEQVTLTASNGILQLDPNQMAAVVAAAGAQISGNGTSQLTIKAVVGDLSTTPVTPGIDTVLEILQYVPDPASAPYFAGPATITVVANDLGNSPPPAKATTVSLPINVIAVNNPPVTSAPPTASGVEDKPITFSTATGNAIAVSDPDIVGAAQADPTLSLLETISANNGTLSLATVAGLSNPAGGPLLSGTGPSLTFTGSVSAINAALNGMTFLPTPEYSSGVAWAGDRIVFSSAATVSVSGNELSLTGAGGEVDVAANASGSFINGQTVTVTAAVGNGKTVTTTFEFDSDNHATANARINVAPGDTAYTLALDAAEAISQAYIFPAIGPSGVASLSAAGNIALNQQATATVTGSSLSVANSGAEIDVAPSATGASINGQTMTVALPLATGEVYSATFEFNADAHATNNISIVVNPTDNATTLTLDALTQINASFQAALPNLGILANDVSAALITIQTNDLGNTGVGPNHQIGVKFPLSAPPATIVATISAQTDNPVLDGGSETLQTIQEVASATTNPGTTVAAMLSTGANGQPITLRAAGAKNGIAVTAFSDTTDGTWQYSLDGGNSWNNFVVNGPGAVSTTSALLLDSADSVRFLPNPFFQTDSPPNKVSMTFYAWDETTAVDLNTGLVVSLSAGGTANLTTLGPSPIGNSGSSPFSNTSAIATLAVTAENVSPPAVTVPVPTSGVFTTPEDTPISFTGINVSDQDQNEGPQPSQVKVTVSTDPTTGVLALGSTAGLTSVSGNSPPSASIILQGSFAAVNSALDGLTFTPLHAFAGASTITLVANDLGNFGGGGALNSTPATLNVQVVAVHQAPILGSSPPFAPPVFPTIAENVPIASNPSAAQIANGAYSIGTMLSTGGAITSDQVGTGFLQLDTDTGAIEGIAVTSLTGAANGVWEYSLNNGLGWISFGPVATTTARLLASGDLVRFRPNQNFSGAVSMSFVAWDQTNSMQVGGLVNLAQTGQGGQTAFSAASQTATLTVALVNEPPAFGLMSNTSTLENNTIAASGGVPGVGSNSNPIVVPGFAFGITSGPVGQPPETVTFFVSTDRPDLFATDPVTGLPEVSIDGTASATPGTLRYTLAKDVFGVATLTVYAKNSGGTANGGNDTSLTHFATITIGGINDPPTLDPISNPAPIPQDSTPLPITMTGITAGLNESQVITITAATTPQTGDNPSLVTNLLVAYNSPNTTGTLTYSLAPGQFGTEQVTVTVTDNGTGTQGGVNTFTRSFVVTATSNSPTATPQVVTTLENTPTSPPIVLTGTDPTGKSLSAVISGLPTGGTLYQVTSTGGQGAAITAVNTPLTNAANKVIYAPATDANGSPYDSFSFYMTEIGGTLSSAPANVTIYVTPVNQAPTFVAGPSETVLVGAGAQTIAGWATQISPGAPNESNQTLTFIVTQTGGPSGLLAALPSISASGTLSVAAAGTATGTDNFSVVLMDNGGTANGGHNTSAPQSFSITVTSTPPAPLAKPDTFVLSTSASSSATSSDGVLVNDVSEDNQHAALRAVLTSSTTHGQLLFNADGSFTYTPGIGFEGLDQFTYEATEGTAASQPVIVSLLSYQASIVDKLYNQVLGRSADASGLQFWTTQIMGGASYGVVAQGIFESDERLNAIIAGGQLGSITYPGYYPQYLLRPADPAGLAYWKGIWKQDGGPDNVIAGMIGSPEFFASAGQQHPNLPPNGAWVTALYERLLNREPEPAGYLHWTNALDNGILTRQQVVLGFVDSTENFTNLVNGFFQQYLQRSPSPTELNAYVAEFQAGASQRDVQIAIIDLPEYANTPPAPAPGTVGQPKYPF